MRQVMGASRKYVSWLALLLAGAALTVLHVQVTRSGWESTGFLLLVDRCFDLMVVLATLVVCAGVGRLVLRRCAAEPSRPIELLAFSTTLGIAVVSTLILAVGLAGYLSALVLGFLLLLLAVAARDELRRLPQLTASTFLAPWHESKDAVFLAYGLSVSVVATLLMSLFALSPPVEWDGLMYHLQLPAEYLERGRIFLPEDNLHAPYVGVMHMLYLPLLAVASDAGPAMLNVAMAVLLGLVVYSFGSRFLGVRTGQLSLGLLWGTTTILLVAISPRVDVTLSLFLFLGHYAVISDLSDPEKKGRMVWIGAALLGAAVGIKLSAIPYALALAPLVVWALAQRATSLPETGRNVTLFGALAVGVSIPWLVKNWMLLGAPLYPYLAEPLIEGWLAPLFGSTAWPAEVDQGIRGLVWELRKPFNFYDAFFFPGRLTLGGEARFYYLNPALLLLPLWLLFIRNRVLNWLVVPAVAYVVIVLALLPSLNLRYLLPAVPPLTIAVVYVATKLGERLLSEQARNLILLTAASMALLPTAFGFEWHLRNTLALSHFVGASSDREYVESWSGAYVDVLSQTNAQLTEDSRMLMLFEARGYYFKTPVIQDNLGTNWPLLASAITPGECLDALGITHVLLGLGALQYFQLTGNLVPERVNWAEFQQYADRCLEQAYSNPAYVVFREKAAAGSSETSERANRQEN